MVRWVRTAAVRLAGIIIFEIGLLVFSSFDGLLVPFSYLVVQYTRPPAAASPASDFSLSSSAYNGAIYCKQVNFFANKSNFCVDKSNFWLVYTRKKHTTQVFFLCRQVKHEQVRYNLLLPRCNSGNPVFASHFFENDLSTHKK